MTTIAPPPRPQPSQEELEALIEEARRRARRRRLAYGAAAVIVLAAAGVVLGIVLTQRGGSSTTAPAGYHFVHAKGMVSHVRVEEVWLSCRRGPVSSRPVCGPEPKTRLVDLATGKAQPASDVQEVWWDPKSGLVRVVERTAGEVAHDTVGQQCDIPGSKPGAPRFCNEPPPFGLAKFGFALPVDPSRARIAARGVVRGHDVIWVENLVPQNTSSRPQATGERVAFDVRTHEPVARRAQAPGLTEFFSRLPNLPGKSVKFIVPDGGAPRNSYPPGDGFTDSTPRPVDQTQKALGRTPFWLGRSYHGHRLQSAAVGTVGEKAANGARLDAVPFVSFDYGVVRLQEFGKSPYFFEHGPPHGKLLLDASEAALRRNGVLVLASTAGPAVDTPSGSLAAALAMAKALRPLR
jgi:hypothetical protein